MNSQNAIVLDKAPVCRPRKPLSKPVNGLTGRILIVEPDPAMRGLISNSLRHLGHQVTETEDSKSALVHVSNGETFDLVVTDLDHGSTGGIAMARKILDQGATAGILLMTESLPLSRVLARSIGSGMCITKPFTAEDFLHRVEEVLRRALRTKSHASHTHIWAKQRLGAIGNRPNRRLWRGSARIMGSVEATADGATPECVN